MAQQQDRFGVDLITFYDGPFWSVDSWHELASRAAREPRWFWDRLLKSVTATGVTGIELTFPPGDWDTAVAAYGSADDFRQVIRAHGLTVTSSYFSALEQADDISDAAQRAAILKTAAETARLLSACDADVLVAGLPARPRPADQPGQFVDIRYASPVADLLNQLGQVTRAEGVKLALHTEMGSLLALPRDIDLFMLLTDPAYVGLCPDTGHIVLAGGDPLKVLDRHAERILITHWKDATGPMPAERPADEDTHEAYAARFRRVGNGVMDWPAWSRRLADAGFSGWNILEIDTVTDPVGQIAAAREFAEAAC
jgi:sugar phosphate isomerase/epimerase